MNGSERVGMELWDLWISRCVRAVDRVVELEWFVAANLEWMRLPRGGARGYIGSGRRRRLRLVRGAGSPEGAARLGHGCVAGVSHVAIARTFRCGQNTAASISVSLPCLAARGVCTIPSVRGKNRKLSRDAKFVFYNFSTQQLTGYTLQPG